MIIKLKALLVFLLCFQLSIQQNCGQINTFEDGKVPLQEIFVSETGSPSGTGTQQDPFNTVQKAVAVATPGTAIRIFPGTYGATSPRITIYDLVGTEENPIWLGGIPGMAKPVFGSASVVEGLHLTRVKYLIVHNIEVRGATGNGVNADDGGDYENNMATHHVIFRDLYIHDIGLGGNQDCLKLSGLNNHIVMNNVFQNCSSSGVDHVGCHHGLIISNQFIRTGNGVQSKGGSEDIEIRWNRFEETVTRSLNMGGSTGFEYFRPPLSTTNENYEAKNIRSIANLFISDGDCSHAFVGCVDCIAVQNTIVTTRQRLFRILQETFSTDTFTFASVRNATIMNNLMYYSNSIIINGGRAINVSGGTTPESFTWRNNWWFAIDGNVHTPAYGGGTTINESYNINPRLNMTTYNLQSDSPAIADGTSLSLPYASTGDFSGRCFLNPPSIGAFQYYEPVPDTTSTTGGIVTSTTGIATTGNNDSTSYSTTASSTTNDNNSSGSTTSNTVSSSTTSSDDSTGTTGSTSTTSSSGSSTTSNTESTGTTGSSSTTSSSSLSSTTRGQEERESNSMIISINNNIMIFLLLISLLSIIY